MVIFGDQGSRNMNSRIISAGFLVITLGFCAIALCQQEPAGEGRPLTPAGALVIDAATHLPTLGAMRMGILPTPDSLGHGGKGQVLLQGISRFRVQLSGE